MPNGLGAILAALAGGASGYAESKQKQRAEALVAERLRREEENDARNEARQQRQDAIALARDKAHFLDLGATTVDPNVVSGQAQRDTQKGMAMAQDILGTQSSVPTPVADLPPATTQRGLALASAELPSKYEPQAQLSGILKDKQTALSAMDATMRNSVQLGDSRYTIPSAASKQALLDAKIQERLAKEGKGYFDLLGLDPKNASDETYRALANNPTLGTDLARANASEKKTKLVDELSSAAMEVGADGKPTQTALVARLRLESVDPMAYRMLMTIHPNGIGDSKAFTQLNQRTSAAAKALAEAIKNSPRPSHEGKSKLDPTLGKIVENPAYPQIVRDSIAYDRNTVQPARETLENLRRQLLGGPPAPAKDDYEKKQSWSKLHPKRVGENTEDYRKRYYKDNP